MKYITLTFSTHTTMLLKKIFFALFILLSLSSFITAAETVNVTLTNTVTGEPLSNKKISVVELLTDNNSVWRSSGVTDNNGLVQLTLAGVNEGKKYQLTTRVYHGFVTKSVPIITTDDINFQIAATEITVLNGSSEQLSPIKNKTIFIHKIKPDGSLHYFYKVKTTDQGKIHLDLPELSSGIHYKLQMKSAINNTWLYSHQHIEQTGSQSIIMGNRPLRVTLQNSISHDAIPNQRIDLYEKLADGTDQWRAKQDSDAQGKAAFDLEGFDGKRQYFLQSKVYNGFTVKTALFNTVAQRIFRVGSTDVTVINGSVSPAIPLVNKRIYLQRVEPDGTIKYFTKVTTDNQGRLRLDLPSLDSGIRYKLQTLSVINGSWVYSDKLIDNVGILKIKIGNLPLKVTVKNTLSGEKITEQKIDLYEKLEDGTAKWHARQISDHQGQVNFDFNGFDGTRQYFLQSKIYNGFISKTTLFNSVTERVFSVGSTELTVYNGNISPVVPLANQKIYIIKIKADGSLEYFTKVTTNQQGKLQLDLPDLTHGTDYKLQMKSLVNNSWIYSNEQITATGKHNITIGNLPLKVSLKNAITNNSIVNQRIDLYEKLADNSIKWRSKQTTDSQGNVLFDVSGFDGNRQYFLQSKVYNNFSAKTKLFNTVAERTFHVGSTEITVHNGNVLPITPLANQKVYIPIVNANGSLQYFTKVITNPQGKLQLDLPELDNGRQYKLQMKSTINSSWIYSEKLIQQTGLHSITIGNLPLKVQLKNALTNEPIPSQRIDLYERLADGSNTWRAKQFSNATGQVNFDISGFDGERQYFLQSRVYNDFPTKSVLFTSTNERTLLVGSTEITVLNGNLHPTAPLLNTKVYIPVIQADGSRQYFAQAVTDNQGKLRIDLPGLTHGTNYQLQMRSLANNNWIYSETLIQEAGVQQIEIGNLPLNVKLKNALTNEVITNQRIHLFERLADNNIQWRAKQNTNNQGIAIFDVSGFDGNRQYFLQSKVYNEFPAKTAVFTTVEARDFTVGSTEITVMNGTLASSSPLINKKIRIPVIQPDGSLEYFAKATTDLEGKLRLDLPGLGAGTHYKLQMRSILNGSWIYSDTVMQQAGLHTITLGNFPLTVTLKNALSYETITDQRIDLYEINSDGSQQWRAKQITNNQGIVIFDVNGFDGNRQYFLQSKVYNGFAAKSVPFTQQEEKTFAVGSTEITVINGAVSPNTPLRNKKIHIPKVNPDGSLAYFTKATTDDEGKLRLDLPGLGDGSQYILQMKSTVNDSWIYSETSLQQAGSHQITIGNVPLNVTLKNVLNDELIVNKRIDIYEKLNDGSHLWRAKQTTDNQGMVNFDISGFDGSRQYFLKSKVYNNFPATTELFTAVTDRIFDVGSTEISVFNGNISSNTPLINQKVYIPLIKDDGSLEYFAKATTDNDGKLRLNLPNLNNGAKYKLQIKSLINGSWIFSDTLIEDAGLHNMTLGNLPLNVTLKNAITDQLITNKRIDVYEKLADGSRQWRAKQFTDSNGFVAFDISGFDGERQYYLRTKVYNNFTAKSDFFTTVAERTFAIGSTEITVLNGTSAALTPLSNHKIRIPILKDDGSHQYFTKATTDSEGKLHLDLPEIDDGRQYKLQMRSLINNSWIYSDDVMSSSGKHTISMGSQALTVTAINDITELALNNLTIIAQEKLTDGSYVNRSQQTTDENGQVAFDLNGLGAGRQFILKSKPYNSGFVHSRLITTTGPFTYRLGSVPVTLYDVDNEQPIAGKKVHAFIVNDDDSISWQRKGTTNSSGLVHFDFDALTLGQRYVLLASGPYGNNKNYYSDIINSTGPVTFAISRQVNSPLDTQRPTIAINFPLDNGVVDSSGFTLIGSATDNASVSQVFVSITDSIAGQSQGLAEYDNNTQTWQYMVNTNAITEGATAIVQITATDENNNDQTLVQQYQVINDQVAPIITITSHQSGSNVSALGFTLIGNISDNIEADSILATVIDPVLGSTIFQQPLDFIPDSGQWALIVRNGQLTEGESLSISLSAFDTVGNQANSNISLNVTPIPYDSLQLINRTSFGITAQLYNEINDKGAEQYLSEQLNPTAVDNSDFDNQMEDFIVNSKASLKEYQLRHMIYSKRQLLEVMTWFWENHFSTDINKTQNPIWELAENNNFRINALGNFRDLLAISAKSPAMLTYLDTIDNNKAEPNENYARELLELHTMGVDGGYSHTDIEALARVFTGWHIANEQFSFNTEQHDSNDKLILGQVITGGGVEEGEQVFDILAKHPATAQYICYKLSQVFISDTPAQLLVNNCAARFLSSHADIYQVMQFLLTSAEFVHASHYRIKIKTPVEYVVGIIRALNAEPDYHKINDATTAMGLKLFESSIPTGWSETGDDWLSSNFLLQRLRFNNRVLHLSSNNNLPDISLIQLIQENGYETVDGIVGFTLNLLLNREFTLLEFTMAQNILTDDGPFNINNSDSEIRLKRLFSTVMSFSGYQYQ